MEELELNPNSKMEELELNPNSQVGKVYNWMKTYGSIDLVSAAFSIGCFCLPQRIADLKAMGLNIASERVFGKQYKRYWIVEEKDESQKA